MRDNLRLAGARLERGRAAPEEEAAVLPHLERHLERLAAHEHDRWMEWHLEQGWQLAAERDDDRRLHPSLVPYGDLGEAEKEKDRDSILRYPEFAARAGRRIVLEAPPEVP